MRKRQRNDSDKTQAPPSYYVRKGDLGPTAFYCVQRIDFIGYVLGCVGCRMLIVQSLQWL